MYLKEIGILSSKQVEEILFFFVWMLMGTEENFLLSDKKFYSSIEPSLKFYQYLF